MPKAIDLTGQKFGRLTVIRKVESYSSKSGKHKDTCWLCRCSCPEHNEIVVTRGRLKSGVTKSCGCIRKETTAAKNKLAKSSNNYDLTGGYGVGYTRRGEVFLFDLEDYEKIRNHLWRYDHEGYVVTSVHDGEKVTSLKLHMIVMPKAPNGFVIDHIIHPENPKGHKADNRKSNLRFVTKAQNAQNQVPLRKNNTSSQKGVSWNKNGCWVARISANGKLHTKYFPKDCFELACKWYEEMAEILHGEYKFRKENDDV